MLSQLGKLTSVVLSTSRSNLVLISNSKSPFCPMNFSTEALVVKHEPLNGRFIINHEGHEAKILYKLKGHTINFTHTGVPKEMEGKGVGSLLAKEALQFAKDKDLNIEVSCTFVKHYIDKYEPQLAYISKI